jgi:hypothetical protein
MLNRTGIKVIIKLNSKRRKNKLFFCNCAYNPKSVEETSSSEGQLVKKFCAFMKFVFARNRQIYYIFFLSPRMQQPFRRHSAAMLTGNGSDMQGIHPVMYRL